MDLGRVSVLGGGRGQQYNFLKMKLSDDFRRAGIGACLEGEWDELWYRWYTSIMHVVP